MLLLVPIYHNQSKDFFTNEQHAYCVADVNQAAEIQTDVTIPYKVK